MIATRVEPVTHRTCNSIVAFEKPDRRPRQYAGWTHCRIKFSPLSRLLLGHLKRLGEVLSEPPSDDIRTDSGELRDVKAYVSNVRVGLREPNTDGLIPNGL